MPDPISIKLPAVLQRVANLPVAVTQAAAIGMQRGLSYCVGVAQREFLQGPRSKQRLGERSGHLRNSIQSKVQIVPGKGVIGRIGTNVSYGAFHEFGFHGIEQVRAHTRVISQVTGLGQEVDLRRHIRDDNKRFIGFKESRKASSRRLRTGFVGVQFVKAHSREVDYAGRPFIAPALEKTLPTIQGEIMKEIAKV